MSEADGIHRRATGEANGQKKEEPKETKVKTDEETPPPPGSEFGGSFGMIFIFVFSHTIVLVLTSSIYGTDVETYMPTSRSFLYLLSYQVVQLVFAAVMPGIVIKGPTGMEYLCNAYASFFSMLAMVATLQFTGCIDCRVIVVEFPAFLVTSLILADVYTLLVFGYGLLWGEKRRGLLEDFFMGNLLHPRLGVVDIKMLAEVRVSWFLLFMITVTSLGLSFENGPADEPALSSRRLGLMVMCIAHFLYANACAKGEHFIPFTWDMTTERFGWMLCFWNLSGVAFLYAFQSLYLANLKNVEVVLPPMVPPVLYYLVVAVVLVVAYCIFDECQYQKNMFKMLEIGRHTERKVWPLFRGVTRDAECIRGPPGVLLVEGWMGVARKINYTADATMALCWGLTCGFANWQPYFYFIFFTAMIIHRTVRDEVRCAEKYGPSGMWAEYCKRVPYRYFPGVF